jgi:hypothetical protein
VQILGTLASALGLTAIALTASSVGGCGGGSAPTPPTVSPYEQAKGSFDAYKEEFLKRSPGRTKAGASKPR